MKKILLSLVLAVTVLASFAQSTPPSYLDIIQSFCANYAPSEDYENYTCFARKKDGWYVLQTNRVELDKVLQETLFYSFAENKYQDISSQYEKASDPDMSKQLEKFLTESGGAADWYGFERIPYYGYDGWHTDLIKDYGHLQNLSDTMYDALGRAYDKLAVSYLWYQTGGAYTGNDTLQRKLGRLEYPSRQRISKLKAALDSAISQFNKLNKINPSYTTIVGNATLKLFNEYMHGYNQMMMCGNDSLADDYLQKASLPEPYLLQAKNYLNSCEPGAILFTYGDNDTYQLWYAQKKLNFRADVVVINSSLLGLPVYIDMFKRKKIIPVSAPDSFLTEQSSEVAYFKENSTTADLKKAHSLKDFLQIIYSRKYALADNYNIHYSTYPWSKAFLVMQSKNTVPAKPKTIRLNLKKYYAINDIALLDIIDNNINQRPIYFTSAYNTGFDSNLIQKGIIYKLIAENINHPKQKNAEVAELQKFIAEKHHPVLSNNTDINSFDGDNSFFMLYFKILDYYFEKKDNSTAKAWLNKLTAAVPSFNALQIKTARNFGPYFLEAGEIEKGLQIMNQYAQWLSNAYYKPAALTGLYTKATYLSELKQLKESLLLKNQHSELIDALIKKAN